MEIKNITDFVAVFPPSCVIEGRSQYNSPCPMCSGSIGTSVILHNNRPFWGTDRLVWRLNDNSFYCRHCHKDGRGHNGTYFAWEMAKFFDVAFDPLLTEPTKPRSEIPIAYWTYGQVLMAHANVQRDYWKRFGWDDETIDHFKLGYGTLYRDDGAVHLIPMSIRTPAAPPIKDLYYMSGRRHDLPAKRAYGSIHNYFWFIHEDRDSREVVLAEGEKDAITLWHLGYRNIAVTFGTSSWSQVKTKFLADIGFTSLTVFGDNDEAGVSFNKRVTSWASGYALATKCLKWHESIPLKFDVTDQLEVMGREGLQAFIKDNLVQYEVEQVETVVRPSFIPDYKTVDPHYKLPTVNPTALDTLRGKEEGSIQHSIERFLTTYNQKKKRGRGILKLLLVPPGGGKTHTLVRVSEKIALAAQQRSYMERKQLRDELTNQERHLASGFCADDEREETKLLIEHLKDQIENYSNASVFIATQFKSGYDDLIAAGASSNLVYNYQARDSVNCQNYDTVVALGKKNHDIGAFCATGCPFKELCQKNGYLGQEKRRRQKPITVFRHQHLLNQSLIDEYRDLVIVDEAPFHILETPLVVTSTDIDPHNSGWYLDVHDSQILKSIELFTDALKAVLLVNFGQKAYLSDGVPNPNYTISGTKLLNLLDLHIKNSTENQSSLEFVISHLDYKTLNESYHPTFRGGETVNLQLRCVPNIYKAIANEIKNYSQNPTNELPSCLHLVGGRLEIYQMERLRISSNIPVVVADATAMIPELYDATFGRQLDIFAPQIVNPNAEVIQVRGSDWTLSQIEREIGRELRDRKKRVATVVTDIVGDTLSLDEIPTNANLYNSTLVKDYLDTILALAERHNNLLVVTHKKIRDVLEDVLRFSSPKVYARLAFGHYGALRGTNAFKDYEAVVLIGVSRIPYDVMWRKIQAWGKLLDIGEPIPYSMNYTPTPYHMQTQGHSYITFDHQFAKRYADMVEMGEMIQCQERIRPHATDKRKTSYIVTNRPAVNFVTRIVTKTELLNFYRSDSKINRARDFIMAMYLKNQDVPRKEDIMARFECGYSTYKQARDAAEQKLNVVFPNKRR